MDDRPLTATEIKEGLVRKHESDCNCELCYVRCLVESRQEAILKPLIRRVEEVLRKKV